MMPTVQRVPSPLGGAAAGAGRSAVSGSSSLAGLRDERALDALRELLERQPAVAGRGAQDLDRALPLGVGRAQRAGRLCVRGHALRSIRISG